MFFLKNNKSYLSPWQGTSVDGKARFYVQLVMSASVSQLTVERAVWFTPTTQICTLLCKHFFLLKKVLILCIESI